MPWWKRPAVLYVSWVLFCFVTAGLLSVHCPQTSESYERLGQAFAVLLVGGLLGIWSLTRRK